MEQINVKVAFCTECEGYYAATPVKVEDYNHPEIIDHYFYHGEPHFTLCKNSFEENAQFLNTEIRIVELSEHQANDHRFCHCLKKANSLRTVALGKNQKETLFPVQIDKVEMDAEIYFTDLYHTYNNFHGVNTSNKRSASA